MCALPKCRPLVFLHGLDVQRIQADQSNHLRSESGDEQVFFQAVKRGKQKRSIRREREPKKFDWWDNVLARQYRCSGKPELFGDEAVVLDGGQHYQPDRVKKPKDATDLKVVHLLDAADGCFNGDGNDSSDGGSDEGYRSCNSHVKIMGDIDTG